MKSTRTLTPSSKKFESAHTYQQKPKYKNSLATCSMVINADILMFRVFLGDRRNEHLVQHQALFSGLLRSIFPAIWPWISDYFEIIFLPGARSASAFSDQSLQEQLHFQYFVPHTGGKISWFPQVIGKIIKLHGLGRIHASGPASGTRCGIVFPGTHYYTRHTLNGGTDRIGTHGCLTA